MTDQVSLIIVTDIVQRALVKYPEHRIRIENAVLLIVKGHIERNADGGCAVRSQTQPGHRYAVSHDDCACEDRRRHQERACKHMMGLRILLIAEERQRVLDQRERFALLSSRERAKLTELKQRHTAAAR